MINKVDKKKINFWQGGLFLFLAAGLFLLPAIFVYWDAKKISFSMDPLAEKRQAEERKVFPDSSVKFSYFTDAHCYGKTKEKSEALELNWRCTKPIEEIGRRLAGFGAEFIVDGGDLVDGRDKRSAEDFLELRRIFSQMNLPFYQVLGNHETRSFKKEEWLAMTSNQTSYYHFDVREYRFIVLDGNFFIEGGEIKDTNPDREFYPGLINQRQMRWLRKTLAQSRNRKVVVFLHQPPIDGTFIKDQSMFLANRKELQKVFSQYGVKAVFSGHVEELCAQNIDGVDYYLAAGFWKPNPGYSRRFKDEGFFYQIEIDQAGELKMEVFLNPDKDSDYESFSFDKNALKCSNSGAEQVSRIDQLLPSKISQPANAGNEKELKEEDDDLALEEE